LLACAGAHNIKLHKMDVKSVFLNGYTKELVYVEKPPGFEDDNNPNHIYKLRKALYGLKEAPRAWYERLRDFLLSKGLKVGKLTPLFSPKRLEMTYLYCKFMLMTSYLDQPIKTFVKSLGR
jgi:hypothetical protein